MPRRKRTPEEIARKERTKALMKELNIKDMDDIQDLFKSFVAAALEGGLEAELDEELGYSKYDYRNKETNNSRNGYSKKTMKTSFGAVSYTHLFSKNINDLSLSKVLSSGPSYVNMVLPSFFIHCLFLPLKIDKSPSIFTSYTLLA